MPKCPLCHSTLDFRNLPLRSRQGYVSVEQVESLQLELSSVKEQLSELRSTTLTQFDIAKAALTEMLPPANNAVVIVEDVVDVPLVDIGKLLCEAEQLELKARELDQRALRLPEKYFEKVSHAVGLPVAQAPLLLHESLKATEPFLHVPHFIASYRLCDYLSVLSVRSHTCVARESVKRVNEFLGASQNRMTEDVRRFAVSATKLSTEFERAVRQEEGISSGEVAALSPSPERGFPETIEELRKRARERSALSGNWAEILARCSIRWASRTRHHTQRLLSSLQNGLRGLPSPDPHLRVCNESLSDIISLVNEEKPLDSQVAAALWKPVDATRGLIRRNLTSARRVAAAIGITQSKPRGSLDAPESATQTVGVQVDLHRVHLLRKLQQLADGLVDLAGGVEAVRHDTADEGALIAVAMEAVPQIFERVKALEEDRLAMQGLLATTKDPAVPKDSSSVKHLNRNPPKRSAMRRSEMASRSMSATPSGSQDVYFKESMGSPFRLSTPVGGNERLL